MFKNVIVYRIGPDWSATVEQMEEALEPLRFVECVATQEKSLGWVEPRGEKNGALVESVGGQRIMKLRIDTKAVPGSVVKRKAQEKIEQIEATTGRKPGKKESREICENIMFDLLPMAFPKESSVLLWIDMDSRLLVIDASTQSKADEAATALVTAMPGLSMAMLQTARSPKVAMTQWLTAEDSDEELETDDLDEFPTRMSIEHGGELKSTGEEKSVVKFARHTMLTCEVRQHIAQGKLPTRLDMSWDGRVAFTLTDTLKLKKISFLEGAFDGTSAQNEDGFDADVAISTGELRGLIRDLIDALGGEK